MSQLRRALLIVLSIGWIAPLCLAFWAEHNFVFDGLFRWLNTGEQTIFSFHPVSYAPSLFYLSMAWLAGVITWWVLRLTRPSDLR